MRSLTDEDRDQLASWSAEIAIAILGDPSTRKGSELRFGRHGSCAVVVDGPKRGTWFDHEAGEGGDMLALATKRLGLSFPDALQFCGDIAGLRFDGDPVSRANLAPMLAESRRKAEERRRLAEEHDAESLAQRVEDGETIWNEARPIGGTLAERHLVEHRLLTLEGVNEDWCRFHPAPVYRKEAGGGRLETKRLGPSMVCLIRDVLSGAPCGLRITVLDATGGKAFRVVIGRLRQGAVMIDDDADVTRSIAIAEGVETALRLRQNGEHPIWATCNAGNMAAFPVLPVLETIRIYADADRTDERGRTAGLDAARECALRWQEAGQEALIFLPPETGTDWDDVLKGGLAA